MAFLHLFVRYLPSLICLILTVSCAPTHEGQVKVQLQGLIAAPVTISIFAGDIQREVIAAQTNTEITIDYLPVGKSFVVDTEDDNHWCWTPQSSGLVERVPKAPITLSCFPLPETIGKASWTGYSGGVSDPEQLEEDMQAWFDGRLVEAASATSMLAPILTQLPALEISQIMLAVLAFEEVMALVVAGAVALQTIATTLLAVASVLVTHLGAAALMLAAIMIVVVEIAIAAKLISAGVTKVAELATAVLDWVLESTGLKEREEFAECMYRALGGPQPTLHELVETEQLDLGTSVLAEDVEAALDELQLPTIPEMEDWIPDAINFVDANAEQLESQSVDGHYTICGVITYTSNFEKEYEPIAQKYSTLLPSAYRPARRIQVSLSGTVNVDTYTNDVGAFKVQVPNGAVITQILVKADITNRGYQNDNLPPDNCNGASWSTWVDSTEYQDFVPVVIEATKTIQIHYGLRSRRVFPVQFSHNRFSKNLRPLDILIAGFEHLCEAKADRQFPAFKVQFGEIVSWDNPAKTLSVNTEFMLDPDAYLHEFGHYTSGLIYQRDDTVGWEHGKGKLLDPATAFSEGFAVFFASATLDDPYTTTYNFNLEDGDTDESDYWFHGASPMSEAAVAQTLWHLYKDNDYGYKNLDATYTAFANTNGFTNILGFLAYHRALHGEISDRIHDYVNIPQESLVCASDECASLNQQVNGFSIDVFDTQNLIGSQLTDDSAVIHPETPNDPFFWQLYGPDPCMQIEQGPATAHNTINPRPTGFFDAELRNEFATNRWFYCRIDETNQHLYAEGVSILDTDTTCAGDEPHLVLKAYRLGPHNSLEERLIGETSGPCPLELNWAIVDLPAVIVLNVQPDLTSLKTLAFIDCFAFWSEGCSHLRE